MIADSPTTAIARVAFIGGGNMAAALIGGLLKTGWPVAKIAVAEPVTARADWLRAQFGVPVAASAAELGDDADALVLAVKPQQMREALAGIRTRPGALVVSIAAGVRLATLRRLLGDSLAYVRTMPNTPALFGAGITGLYAPAGTPDSARALAQVLLAAAGDCVWVQREEELDAVTALSGSGPAYFFLLVEALREAGTALGLAPEVAAQLAAQTCIGAARMVADAGQDVSQLRANVTSKGGTTEAALQHLESAGLRAIFAEALRLADARAKQLGDALDTD
ncbi:MAG: pyrroline-5-carboxylate reductase [Stagnimonas sp.]|nr:pyrroline-5-carboxylate reductase [Stagnimonas sp.]